MYVPCGTTGAPTGKAALLAALTPVVIAAYDLVKVLLARFTGNPDSASLLTPAE
jgi:hypothetical protein